MTSNTHRLLGGLATAVAGVATLVVTARVFVGMAAGQRVDETALRGSRIGRDQLIDGAMTALGVISVAGLAVMTAVAVVIAVSRRRFDLALAAVILVGGANVTTQLVKALLDRPDLGIDTITLNSLPSGHTTVALSVAAALVIVVPASLRPATALVGASAAALIGVATMAVAWHRPSDVVAAVGVVGAWVGVTIAGLAVLRPTGHGPAAPRSARVTAVALAAVGAAAVAFGIVAMWHTLGQPSIPDERADLLVAYGGGVAGASAMMLLLVAVTLTLTAGIDGPAQAAAPPGSTDADLGAQPVTTPVRR